MHIRELRRWKWCFRGGSTLALGVAIVCCGHAGTAIAQCPSGGGGAATAGGAGGAATSVLAEVRPGNLVSFRLRCRECSRWRCRHRCNGCRHWPLSNANEPARTAHRRPVSDVTNSHGWRAAEPGQLAREVPRGGQRSPEQSGSRLPTRAARGTERDRRVARMRDRGKRAAGGSAGADCRAGRRDATSPSAGAGPTVSEALDVARIEPTRGLCGSATFRSPGPPRPRGPAARVMCRSCPFAPFQTLNALSCPPAITIC